MTNTLIIGAGQAGFSLAARLRALGHTGPITLIGDEPAPPYQRPPLSKKYLLGEMARERLFLRPQTYFAEQNITLRLGQPASAIDARAKTVVMGDETLSYQRLAITTGAAARPLPAAIGGTLEGVYTVRTLADIDAMAPEFQPGRRLLIVGGGYIGLEAAAVAAQKGLHVTLIEMAPRILQRVAAAETSDYFRALHSAHGVDIRENCGLDRLTGAPRVDGAFLADGSRIAADFVIVGIGVTPRIDLAQMAGLAVENGIAVDARGQTSDRAIWAAGDCASFPYKGARIRLESVQNGVDQAENAAQNMLGAGRDYQPNPWFWSDQYDVKLQIAGLNTGYTHTILRPGAAKGAGEAQSVWYYDGPRLLAVDAMNDARAYMIGKRLIEAGKSPSPELIANPQTDLKTLLRP